MKYRVTWWLGRQQWFQDYPTWDLANQRVARLLNVGFRTKSRAGVEMIYPPHRIGRIKLRQMQA